MEEKTGLLAEHEPAPKDNEGKDASYQPTDEERKVIKMVMRRFERAKKKRKPYDEKWLDNYKFFRGKQWKENRPTYRHSEVINMVFQAIQSSVGAMTDSRPKIEYLPKEPSDLELCDIMNQVLESDWEQGNWLYVLMESIYDAHIYSTGFGDVSFDPEADFGAGKITYQSDDPFYTYPDPSGKDINAEGDRGCKEYFYAEPVDVERLKRQYPDKAKFIKPDLTDLVADSKTQLDQIRYRSPVDARTMVEGNERPDTSSDQALKITAYLLSDESVEERTPELDEMGEPKLDPVTGAPLETLERRLKYPRGRKIVIAGGVLVEDGENCYEDGKIPKFKITNYILPREFWGISEIEQLESPQKIFNKLISYALDVLTFMGNPIWVIDSDAEIDTDNLFNRPGLIVEKAKGSEVRREEGVQLQPYVLQLIDRMQNWFQEISGRTDVTQGVNPSGVTAASAIAELQESAQTRIRLKTRNLDAGLRDFGALYASRAFQFYSAPRVFRVTRNENAQVYFKMHVEPMEDGRKLVSVRQHLVDEVTGAPGWSEAKQYQTQGVFDVRVTTGSSLPFAKAQKFQLASALFDRGAIDQIELLKAADYPNYEAVWSRVQARQAEQAQAQAAAQGAQAAPPQPGAPQPAA